MTFTKNWRYIILNAPSSPVKPDMIQRGLDSYPVPSKWITLSNDQSIQWNVMDDGYVGKYPWPTQEYTGVFFYYDWNNPPTYKDAHGAIVAPDAGSIGGYNRFSIAVDSNMMYYADMHSIGSRIFHEIVNGYGFPNTPYYADAVFGNASPSSKSQFCASAMKDYRWKNDKEVYDFCNTPTSYNYTYPSPRVEHATLSWCMEKMFPQYCLPDDYNPFGAVKPATPIPPPIQVVPKVYTTTVDIVTVQDYIRNFIVQGVKITITSSAGTVSGITNWVGKTTLTIPCGIPLTVTTVTPRGTKTTFTQTAPQCSNSYTWKLPVGV